MQLDPNAPTACDGAWTDGLRACRQARARVGMEWRVMGLPDRHRASYQRPEGASWGKENRRRSKIRCALAGQSGF